LLQIEGQQKKGQLVGQLVLGGQDQAVELMGGDTIVPLIQIFNRIFNKIYLFSF